MAQENSIKPGFIYVLTHPSDPNLYKIGITTRTPELRLAQHNSDYSKLTGSIVRDTGHKWVLKEFYTVADPVWAETVFWKSIGIGDIPFRQGTLLLAGGTKYTFIAGMIIYGLFSLMFNCFFYGGAGSIDRSGRMATIVVAYSLIPYSLGSFLIGTLANQFSYKLVAIPAVILTLATLFLILPVLRKLDRDRVGY